MGPGIESGNRSRNRYRFSLSGPRFWLAYVAAAGAGICSLPFINWWRTRMGLIPLQDGPPDPVPGGVLVSVVFLTSLFSAAWLIVRRKFDGDPDLAESGRLLLLVYVSCVPVLLILPSHFFELWRDYQLDSHSLETPFWYFDLVLLLLVLLAPVYFAVRDPRHGFFCGAFSSLLGITTLSQMSFDGGIGPYVTGGAMAVVFLYFTSGIRGQRVFTIMTTLVGLANCSPGLAGAMVGTILWRSERTGEKRREEAMGAQETSAEGKRKGTRIF